MIVPATGQPALPLDRLVVAPAADAERIELDVMFVGAGPAGLAGAIELARLVTRALRELFPDLTDKDFPFRGPVTKEAVYLMTAGGQVRIPTPPTMHNRGHYVASLCELVRWLGTRAEELGVNVFTGFPAAQLLARGDRVVGVRTQAAGLDRDGKPGAGYAAPNDLIARVTALSEGTRGLLSQAFFEWQRVAVDNPQIYALGVKEIWETKRPLDRVIHTMGWPLGDAFGGSFLYPLEPHLIALGLVVGLDSRDAATDVHVLLQRLKLHPLVRGVLEGGEMVEWGAKTIPEGGYYSVPRRRSGDGVVVLGDSAGFVDVPSLKGIHYAMQSGMFAARAIFAALKADDTSATRLAEYDRLVNDSFIMRDLYRTRNMRLAFKDGFYTGGFKAALMTLTGGRFPGWRIKTEADAAVDRRFTPGSRPGSVLPQPDGTLTFSKVDAVFKAGNATRDTIPSHLIVGKDVSPELARFYSHVCPAGVYEEVHGVLRVNAPNCVDCKATDVLGPRWTPREGGSGPKYKRM